MCSLNKQVLAGCLLFLGLFGMASCDGSSSLGNGVVCSGPCGFLQVVVKGSKSFNPNIEHGRIITYRVSITGEDIDQPIVADFDGSSTGGVISGIPEGEGRRVVVEAFNPNEVIIRQGGQEDVLIRGGETAEVEVTMEAVPIFTNLADGNTVDNTRLVFQIFSDPADPVAITDEFDDASYSIFDASTSEVEVALDESTGLGKIVPLLQPTGWHQYSVRSTRTGRFSSVGLNVVEGSIRHGAPFFAGGGVSDAFAGRVSSGGMVFPFLGR